MSIQKEHPLKTLSYSVIFYMLLALTWWSILLNKKNTEAFIAKAEVIKLQAESTFGIREYDLSKNENYLLLEQKFKKQQYMILGESLVFTLMLITGVYLINRSYSRELETSRKQQNFLLSITHELKSPLAGIGLVLDTIKKRTLNKDQLDQLADTGNHEKKRLGKLIDNLLMAAKIEGAYHYNFEKTNISPILDDLLDHYISMHPEISFNKSYSKQQNISIDKEAFLSVVNNLISNAIKYQSKDRNLEIEIKGKVKDSQLELSFIDNGIGIDAKEKINIFDKFYRVGSEYTRKTQGTGLGLFIVKKIVEKHKGSIKIQDAKPHGSIFVTIWNTIA